MDPNQSRGQGDYEVGQEGSHRSGGSPVDELFQLAQDVMGKKH
jgi:hypothetical protein